MLKYHQFIKIFEARGNAGIIDIGEILGVDLSDIKNICNIMSDEVVSTGFFVRAMPYLPDSCFNIQLTIQWEIENSPTVDNNLLSLFKNVVERLESLGIIHIVESEPESYSIGCGIQIKLGKCDIVNIEITDEEQRLLNTLLDMDNLEQITDDDDEVDILMNIDIMDGFKVNFNEWKLFREILDEDLEDIDGIDDDALVLYNFDNKIHYPRFK